MDKQPVVLGVGDLTIEEVVGVARYGWTVAEIGKDKQHPQANAAYARLEKSRAWIERAVEENEQLEKQGKKGHAYYGINTGFGSKAGREALSKADLPWVTRNLIVSHSTGMGTHFHPEIVRAAMLIRANSLAQGYSGVRPKLINTLVKMLNEGVCPAIPEYGSVGRSGDLVPLSHLAQVISKRPHGGETLDDLPDDYDESGRAYVALRGDTSDANLTPQLITNFAGGYSVQYACLSGQGAMQLRGIERIELGAKEGLALNNGTTVSAAMAALALYDAENVARHAEIAAALTLEALLGFGDAFLPHVQLVRRHQGQIGCAQRIREITGGSSLLDGDAETNPRCIPPQDAYSVRAVPQVIGAIWDTLAFLRQTISTEINAVTDNPLVFDLPEEHPLHLPRQYRVISGANFHGAPLAYAMDFLGIVMTDLGSLSERGIFRLTDPKLNYGLPAMLIEESKDGLTSGMMIAQYLAASIVSDCKTLAHPDSVDSIPTSASQEDHVSMSMNAARHTRKIVGNVEHVVASQLLCAAIGLSWRIRNLDEQMKSVDKQKIEAKSEYTRSRVDERLLQSDFVPQAGIGSLAAMQAIDRKLYTDENRLPKLDKALSSEDRFLQPYLCRVTELLRSGTLVHSVYEKIDIPLPVRVEPQTA